MFVWIKYVEQSIRELGLSVEGITVESVEQLPHGLNNVYKKYFSFLFRALGSNSSLYQDVVALALLTTRELIPEDIWRHSLGFGDSEDELERFSRTVLEPASKLFLFDSESGIRVLKPPHKSMLDWLEKGAKEMALDELAVSSEICHHVKLAQTLDSLVVSQVLPFAKCWEVDFPNYTPVLGFALSHLVFHLSQAQMNDRVLELLTDFDVVFRLICQAKREERMGRLFDDINNAAKEDKVRLLSSILTLAETAVKHDPRELAGQVLGRVMIPPFDPDQEYWVAQANKWLDRVKTGGGPKVAIPACFGRSGLDPAGSSLLKILSEGSGVVTSVAISTSGEFLVTGSTDRTARVWDFQTGKELRKLKGHSNGVTSVAISPNNEYVVTGSIDYTARVWNLQTGEELKKLKGHLSDVFSVAISPNNEFIVTGSEDYSARVWNLQTGEELKKLEGHSDSVASVAISPNSKFAFTGSKDRTVRVWNLETGKEFKKLEGHSNGVISIAISPNSEFLVTGSSDSTTRVWGLQSGKELRELEKHSNFVHSLATSPNSEFVVTRSRDNTAQVWNLQTGKELKKLEGNSNTVASIAVSLNGEFVIFGSNGGPVRIWDLQTGNVLRELKGHSGKVTSIDISSNNEFVVTGSEDQTARVWNLQTGEELNKLEHQYKVTFVAISPSNEFVATQPQLSTDLVWNLHTGEIHMELKGHNDTTCSLQFSPDGKFAVTGSYDRTVRMWNLQTKEEFKKFKLPVSFANVRISSDSRFFQVNSDLVFEFATGKEVDPFEVVSFDVQMKRRIVRFNIPKSVGFTKDIGGDFVPFFASGKVVFRQLNAFSAWKLSW